MKSNPAKPRGPNTRAPQKPKPSVSKPANPAVYRKNDLYARFHQLEVPAALRSAADGHNEDPIADQNVNVLNKGDVCSDTIYMEAASTESSYFDLTAKPVRVHWKMPVATSKVAGGDVYVDARGLLSNVFSATVEFTNKLQDTITVVINTPFSYITSHDEIAGRKGLVRKELKPDQKFVYHVNWKEDVNLFSPLIQIIGSGNDKSQGLVVADYCVVVPNVSSQSNTAYDPTRSVCEVRTLVNYLAEDAAELFRLPGYKMVASDEFLVSSLADLAAMLGMQPKILTGYEGGRATVRASGVVEWQENSSAPKMSLEWQDAEGRDKYIKLIKADNQGRFLGNYEAAPYQRDTYELKAPIGFAIPQELGWSKHDLVNRFVQTTFTWSSHQGAWLLNGTTNGPFKIDEGYIEPTMTHFPICSLRQAVEIVDVRAVTYDEEGLAIDRNGPYAFSPLKFLKAALAYAKTGIQIASVVAPFL